MLIKLLAVGNRKVRKKKMKKLMKNGPNVVLCWNLHAIVKFFVVSI